MGDQELEMERVNGRRRQKGGLNIQVKGGFGGGGGVVVGVLVFSGALVATAAAIGAVVRARRDREDRRKKRSVAEEIRPTHEAHEEEDNGIKVGGGGEEDIVVEEEEEDASFSQKREDLEEKIEEISADCSLELQIDQENKSRANFDRNLRGEDAEIVATEEEIVFKSGNDGDFDHDVAQEFYLIQHSEILEESKVTPVEQKKSEEAYDEVAEEEEEEEEEGKDSVENEKVEEDPSVEFEATTESSIEESVVGEKDGSDGSRASSMELGIEAVAEVIEQVEERDSNGSQALLVESVIPTVRSAKVIEQKKGGEKEEEESHMSIEKKNENTPKMENGFFAKQEVEWKLEEEEEEEESVENEKVEEHPTVEFEATTESSIEESVVEEKDGSDGSRTSSMELGIEAVAEVIEQVEEKDSNGSQALLVESVIPTVRPAEVIEQKKGGEKEEEESHMSIEKKIENTPKMENGFFAKQEVEWKLEDDANKVLREEPRKIEISNTKTIVMKEKEIGFVIMNQSKGLLVISAFVLTIVLLLFVRGDHLSIFQLSSM